MRAERNCSLFVLSLRNEGREKAGLCALEGADRLSVAPPQGLAEPSCAGVTSTSLGDCGAGDNLGRRRRDLRAGESPPLAQPSNAAARRARLSAGQSASMS